VRGDPARRGRAAGFLALAARRPEGPLGVGAAPLRPRDSALRDLAGAGIVAALTFVVFLPTVANGWVAWDDDTNFLANPHYRGLGTAQLAWMLTDRHAHYMPLTWLTLGLDYVLWGMNPAGYHLTSIVLHAANAGLVSLVALRLMRLALPGAGGAALRTGSGLAALLFAVHPLRVESVAWVTERRDVLCGIFYLLTLLAYLRYCRAGRRGAYATSLALFACALLSKSMAMTLPVVLLLLDAYPLGRRAWREKIPFFVLSAVAAVLAVIAQRTAGAMVALGLLQRIAIAVYALVFYLLKALVPAGLAPMYELPEWIDPTGWRYLASGAVVAALSALAVAIRGRWPAFSVAWACYVVTVLPVSGLVQVGSQLAADRYTYLPLIAVAVLAGGGLARCWAARPALGGVAAVAGGVVIAVLSVLTPKQILVWRDGETLWTHALSTSPSATAHVKLGGIRDAQGRLDEAIIHYREALRIRALTPDAYNGWGIALARQGEWGEAVERYERALAIRPLSAEVHANLATALGQLGRHREAAMHAEIARAIEAERK